MEAEAQVQTKGSTITPLGFSAELASSFSPKKGNIAASTIQRARSDPKSLTRGEVLSLQRTIGNAAVCRLLAGASQQSPQAPNKISKNSQLPAQDIQPALMPATSGVQRYVEQDDTDGDSWRVSDSGKSALFITQAEGGQQLFATDDLIQQANGDLADAGKDGSFIRLEAGDNLKAGLLEGVTDTLVRVNPKLVTLGDDPGDLKLKKINKGLRRADDGKKDKEFALWADCGRSSRAVMGTDGMGEKPRAQVKIGGKDMQSQPSLRPSDYTAVYKFQMPEFMNVDTNRKFLKKDIHYDKKWEDVGIKIWKAKRKTIMKVPADDVEAKKMYWELGEEGRLAFDQQTGINTGANPEIGGAYTMSTEGEMPGFATQGAKTWNFHWAGVVMKDGGENVTLENYAVSYGSSEDPVENRELQQKAYDFVNHDWVFQMYGTKKKGQTFHEQHLASGTHGNRGSSFAVKVGK